MCISSYTHTCICECLPWHHIISLRAMPSFAATLPVRSLALLAVIVISYHFGLYLIISPCGNRTFQAAEPPSYQSFLAENFRHPSPCASWSDVVSWSLRLCLRCRRLSWCGPPLFAKNSCMCTMSLDLILLGLILPIFCVFFFLLMLLTSPYKHCVICLAVDLCPGPAAEVTAKDLLSPPIPVLFKPDVKGMLHLVSPLDCLDHMNIITWMIPR